MKRIVSIVALICAVAFQLNAQGFDIEVIKIDTSVESLRKNAEQAVKVADKKTSDGKKQLMAADALTALAIEEKVHMPLSNTCTGIILQLGATPAAP